MSSPASLENLSPIIAASSSKIAHISETSLLTLGTLDLSGSTEGKLLQKVENFDLKYLPGTTHHPVGLLWIEKEILTPTTRNRHPTRLLVLYSQ